jgi:RimJ/RimL family protein N-acetyltransferase
VLASEIYAVAGILGLRKLSAQMTLDQPGARATFERLGFKPEALLTDWVMSADGRTRDLLVMAYDVTGLTDTV